jgi:tubulin beta
MMQQLEAWTSVHMDSLHSGTVDKILLPESFMHRQFGAGSNWAKGHYTEDTKIMDSVLDMVCKCKDFENSDFFQGSYTRCPVPLYY